MHAILASIGTDGDIIPHVGLGAALRKRGHRVTLAVAEPWRKTALELDLEFCPVVSAEEDRQVLENPDMWHPIKGAFVMARWGTRFFRRQYAQLSSLCDSPDAVIVANAGLIPARVVSEKRRVPMATLILQPWMIKSDIAPPVMPAGLTLPTWAPQAMAKGYWRMINFAGDFLVGKELNRLRRSLDMPPVRCVFEWWLSEQLVIGMFPDWYGPPQEDWDSQVRLAGFPMFDGRAESELPDNVRRFCAAGEPPIAVTFGTGMMHGERLFRATVEACELLGRRGILLSRHGGQLPASLPASVFACPYAPFRKLFPLCAAVVHHGGIGTTAKALASGTPQLIVPIAYDQLDNAIRVKRHGAGDWIKPRKVSGERLAAALSPMLEAGMRQRGAEIARRFENEDALSKAGDWIESLAASKTANPEVCA